MRRVGHRIDRIHDVPDLCRVLADSEVVRRRQPEDVGRDAHTERVQARGGVAQERRDRLLHRLPVLARVADERNVAVAREADVVELDLVEAGFGGGDGHVDVVAPGGAAVRVEPREAAVRPPDRAVGLVNCELGMRDRRDRILEAHEAPDQVDAGRVCLTRDGLRVVIRLGGAVSGRDRGRALDERDVAGLVLHVDLDRVQAVAPERQELLELAREAHQRPGDVDAPDLLRQRRMEGARRRRRAHGLEHDGRRTGRAGEDSDQAEERGGAEEHEHGESRQAAPADPASARLASGAAKLGVVDVRGDCHEGQGSYPVKSLRGPLGRDDRPLPR